MCYLIKKRGGGKEGKQLEGGEHHDVRVLHTNHTESVKS